MSDKIQHLTFEKIMQCLQSLTISEKDYLSQFQLQKALSELNSSPFDDETFQELWDQCRLNSKGQVKVQDFVDYLIKAEEILIDKLSTLETNIVKMELERKPKLDDYAEQKKYKEEIQLFREEKKQTNLSLSIIRKPFENFNKIQAKLIAAQIVSGSNPDPIVRNDEQKPENQLFQYEITQSPGILTKILYGTLCLLALCCLGNYLFSRFFDMTLCLSILVSYVCQSINRRIVKFYLLLLAFSFILMLIWLIIYCNSLWNVSSNYDFPVMSGGYVKFSIGLIFVSFIVKLVLIYYFLTQLRINEMEVYTIYIGSKTIFLQNDPHIHDQSKDPLGSALRLFFNPDANPEKQTDPKQ